MSKKKSSAIGDGNFCLCCGEPHSELLIKSAKGTYCVSCWHGKNHNGGECPAAEEHYRVRFARIGHYIFTNAVGMKQAITVKSFVGNSKPITNGGH